MTYHQGSALCTATLYHGHFRVRPCASGSTAPLPPPADVPPSFSFSSLSLPVHQISSLPTPQFVIHKSKRREISNESGRNYFAHLYLTNISPNPYYHREETKGERQKGRREKNEKKVEKKEKKSYSVPNISNFGRKREEDQSFMFKLRSL